MPTKRDFSEIDRHLGILNSILEGRGARMSLDEDRVVLTCRQPEWRDALERREWATTPDPLRFERKIGDETSLSIMHACTTTSWYFLHAGIGGRGPLNADEAKDDNVLSELMRLEVEQIENPDEPENGCITP